MLKVIVVENCRYCEGETHVLVGEFTDADGKKYPRYMPCSQCHGSGQRERLVTLRELQTLLDQATTMEPDWQELAKEKLVSNYRDSRDSAGP